MFDLILKKLNAGGVLIDHVGQLKNGKKWSATVRKKGTTMTGYGVATNYESAIKIASKNMRDAFDPKPKPKKKRIRV